MKKADYLKVAKQLEEGQEVRGEIVRNWDNRWQRSAQSKFLGSVGIIVAADEVDAYHKDMRFKIKIGDQTIRINKNKVEIVDKPLKVVREKDKPAKPMPKDFFGREYKVGDLVQLTVAARSTYATLIRVTSVSAGAITGLDLQAHPGSESKFMATERFIIVNDVPAAVAMAEAGEQEAIKRNEEERIRRKEWQERQRKEDEKRRKAQKRQEAKKKAALEKLSDEERKLLGVRT